MESAARNTDQGISGEAGLLCRLKHGRPFIRFDRGNAELARRVWERTPERSRALCLYDVKAGAKACALQAAFARASLVAWVEDAAGIDGCLWFDEAGPGTAQVHFVFTGGLGLALTRRILVKQPYQDLVAIVPMPWTRTVAIALEAGFRKLCVLHRACRLADYDRVVNGVLMHFDKHV